MDAKQEASRVFWAVTHVLAEELRYWTNALGAQTPSTRTGLWI